MAENTQENIVQDSNAQKAVGAVAATADQVVGNIITENNQLTGQAMAIAITKLREALGNGEREDRLTVCARVLFYAKLFTKLGDEVKPIVRNLIINGTSFTSTGGVLSTSGGGAVLNYDEDDVYRQLVAQAESIKLAISARKDILNQAHKTRNADVAAMRKEEDRTVVYDSDGVAVTPVSLKTGLTEKKVELTPIIA